VPHFLECVAEGDAVLCIVVECTILRLYGRGHDIAHDGGGGEDGSIVDIRVVGGFVTEEKMPPEWLRALASDKYEALL
jgi:hypothetical protein